MWTIDDEPYYPINDERNSKLLNKYKNEIKNEEKVYFGGRLGFYQYLDMDKVVELALDFIEKEAM